MAARDHYQPPETVRALLPNGIEVTVSAEQARLCHYPIVSETADTEGEQPETDPPTPADVRAWAQATGMDCPDKGRIPERVTQAYRDAHSN
ncbi:Lsr2 family DNA-binding protein [Actinocrispum wychmicini]|uniref:Lsr2 protein n=1 Tax=Actinocrispum wychmicini TaxID=1213861 RepID=A0A4R2JBN5_9PSEU|nr:histone-like nucleoid-structuring protein Lsr2 [Actinocrispum wychmicini]TCO56903.1 Lsr2 protein [Actinocrispum wychmicini]